MRKAECLIEEHPCVRMKTAQLQAVQSNGHFSISNVEREHLKGIFVTRSWASCESTDNYLSQVETE